MFKCVTEWCLEAGQVFPASACLWAPISLGNLLSYRFNVGRQCRNTEPDTWHSVNTNPFFSLCQKQLFSSDTYAKKPTSSQCLACTLSQFIFPAICELLLSPQFIPTEARRCQSWAWGHKATERRMEDLMQGCWPLIAYNYDCVLLMNDIRGSS